MPLPKKIPQLPSIDDPNLFMDVFTHKDLRQAPSSEWGDNDRLAELGVQVLNHVVTFHHFSKRPPVLAEEIRIFRELNTEPKQLSHWLDSYQLKQKLRMPLDRRDAVCNDLQQMAAFFHTYVAGVYLTKGLPTVQTWIAGLIDPDYIPRPVNQPEASTSHAQNNNGPAPTTSASPSSPSTTSGVTVSLVSAVAARRGFSISFTPTQEGEPHQPTWTVRCHLNNVEKGVGMGKTLKVAKEEAARQAWVAMGW